MHMVRLGLYDSNKAIIKFSGLKGGFNVEPEGLGTHSSHRGRPSTGQQSAKRRGRDHYCIRISTNTKVLLVIGIGYSKDSDGYNRYRDSMRMYAKFG